MHGMHSELSGEEALGHHGELPGEELKFLRSHRERQKVCEVAHQDGGGLDARAFRQQNIVTRLSSSGGDIPCFRSPSHGGYRDDAVAHAVGDFGMASDHLYT
jgi:hypothetical protein